MPRTKTTQKKLNLDDEILVLNNTVGTLYIKNNVTGRQWTSDSYGKPLYMTFRDVMDVNSDQDVIFNNAWAIIDNEQAVEHLGLVDMYKHIVKPKDMPKFLKSSESEIRNVLTNAPVGMKQTVIRFIKQKIRENDPLMDSRSRQNLFEELLNIKLDEL